MYKVCSLLLLACCGTGVMNMTFAADAPTEAAANVAAPAVGTTMLKKANVRFGPSLSAKVVVTLDAGEPVEVLGVAQGMPDWYVIRFPRQGSAWVHEKVLKAQEGGKTYIVIEDRARVRDDARTGGNIVAELALGEIVEAKDRARVGAWLPVYPPSAVAYVNKTVLHVPEPIAAAVVKQEEQHNQLDGTWDEVQARYAAYKAALDHDVEIAAKLDWSFLDQQLEQVVTGHPSVRVQLAAKRLKDRIAPVVSAALKVQRQNNLTPSRDVPGQPPIVVVAKPAPTPTEPVSKPVEPIKPAIDPLPTPPVAQPTNPTTPTAPTVPAVGSDQIKQAALNVPTASVSEFAVQGFLEERGITSVGTNYVIIDKNGKVCAFVKAKSGVDLQLSEFFWRLVGVKGESIMIPADKHGQGNAPIPLVTVDDVMLLSR
jgi:SH3-like domain-containing protein